MPKGEPSKATLRIERYQKKAGYKVKAFKIKGDVGERFEKACAEMNVSQASKITELMEQFIAEVERLH